LAATEFLKRGMECELYYNLDYDADENVTDGWVRAGYITSLSINDNPNDFEYYDKWTLQPAKKGRATIDGSLTQNFSNYTASLYKLAKDRTNVALRIDIADDGEGPVTEQIYIELVNFRDKSIDFGDLNGDSDGPVSCTMNFSLRSYKFYQPA
jgi:hypothetical protein